MKKTMTILGVVLFTSILLSSCGSSKKEKITLPDPPKNLKYEGVSLIDGPLSGFVEVVPGEYLLELEKDEDEFNPGYNETIKVKFRFLKSIDVKAGSGYNHYGPGLIGKALDKQGIPLEFEISNQSADTDFATYLKRGSGEEWLTLHVYRQGNIDKEEDAIKLLDKYKKGHKIRFNSEIVEEEFDNKSSSSESNSESIDVSDSSGDSSVDCNKFINGYEKFMNKYIVLLNKMKNNPNDMSVMSDYTSMMTEANQWAAKTADCASDPNFATKMAGIQMKIANAASGM